MKKRLYRGLIALSMTAILFGISACGNNESETFPTETESTEEPEKESEETETTEEEKEESTAKKEEDKEEESKKEENKKSDTEDKSDTKKESESKEESKSESTPKATDTKESATNNSNKTAESTSTPAPTPAPTPTPTPAHEHSYTSSVTQNPTCSSQGVRSYVCSCGASYTESIPSTEHNWKEIYSTVEHPAVTEMREVQVGTSGDVYICNYCNAEFGSSSSLMDHCRSLVGVDNMHATASYSIRDGGPIYESQVVVIQESWTETVVTGYQCSVCGATK